MKSKKIVSLILAAVLVMALAVPALAADNDLVVGGDFKTTPIKVALPATTNAKVVINPYQMVVDIPGGQSGTDTSSDQIFSPVLYLTNFGKSNVSITLKGKITDAAGTGAAPTTVAFQTASVAGKTTDGKQAFVYAQLQVANNTTSKLTWADAASAKSNKSCAILTATEATVATSIVLAKAATPETSDGDAYNVSGSAVAASKSGYAAVKIMGDTSMPKADATTGTVTNWAAADAFGVLLTYVVTPTADAATAA